MTLGSVVGIVILAIIALVIFMFPKECLILARGFARIFIRDMASTPEGAEAIYSEKIEQAQKRYVIAKEAMERAAGRLSNIQKTLQQLENRKNSVEAECESLVRARKYEAAEIKSEERDEIIADIERNEQLFLANKDALQTATEAFHMCEQSLRKLKKEAKDVVENMKMKKQLTEIYNDTDELAASTATDKLLESVREKNRELDERAEGSRIVHNARSATRAQRASEEARRSHSSEYIESLKQKYGDGTPALPMGGESVDSLHSLPTREKERK